jgi:hypothetical protein
MGVKMADNTALALNRVADALFQQAKSTKRIAQAAERQADVAEAMLEVQLTNMRVTAALEQQMMLQQASTDERN